MLNFLDQHALQIFVSSLITFALTLSLIPIARTLTLTDRPSQRKRHIGEVPIIGGICIYLTCLLMFAIFLADYHQFALPLLGFCGLVLLIGVVDDIIDLKAKHKLFALFVIACFTVFVLDLQVSTLGNLFGLSSPLNLGIFAAPATVAAILVLTNAINMIDGCDGLAGSLVLLALFSVLLFDFASFEVAERSFLIILTTSLAVFLAFNLSTNPRTKIFLGDAGSLFLGFIVSLSLVYFSEQSNKWAPSVVLWFVSIPLFDFFCVVIRRFTLRRNIMIADRSHIHHLLLSLGLTSRQTTSVILLAAIVLLCIGLIIEGLYPNYSFFAFIVLFLLYLWGRLGFRKRV